MKKEEVKNIVDNVIKTLGGNIDWDDEDIIRVEEMNHHEGKRPKLPEGKMAIYMFSYKGKFLKIGKVGPKSKSRFRYQHYKPNSCKSNLAKSILEHKEDYDKLLNEDTIADWMFNNLERTNIYLNVSCNTVTLDLFEAALRYKLKPRYERPDDTNYYGEDK